MVVGPSLESWLIGVEYAKQAYELTDPYFDYASKFEQVKVVGQLAYDSSIEFVKEEVSTAIKSSVQQTIDEGKEMVRSNV